MNANNKSNVSINIGASPKIKASNSNFSELAEKINSNEIQNEELIKRAIKFEFIQFIISIIIGSIIIIVGMIILFKNLSSDMDIKFEFLDKTFSISNSLSGIFLSMIGIIIILTSRFKIKIKK